MSHEKTLLDRAARAEHDHASVSVPVLRRLASGDEARGKHRMTKLSRKGAIPKEILRSLRGAYALANRQAAALTRSYSNNHLALLDLQGEIERGADKANTIAQHTQTRADRMVS